MKLNWFGGTIIVCILLVGLWLTLALVAQPHLERSTASEEFVTISVLTPICAVAVLLIAVTVTFRSGLGNKNIG